VAPEPVEGATVDYFLLSCFLSENTLLRGLFMRGPFQHILLPGRTVFEGGFMTLYHKIVALTILAVSSALGASAPFTLSKDSAMEQDLSKKPDTVIMTNTQSDTLRIDSVTMLFDTAQMPECEIQILVLPGAPIRSMMYQYLYRSQNQYYHLALNPNESVKLLNFAIDLCVACPTAGFASAQSRVGDTIRAALVFHKGNFKDTLRIIGKRGVGSMGVRSNPPAGISLHPKATESSFDPIGRRISRDGGAGCVVDKETKRIMVRQNRKTRQP
jgi:hypothetical protein